MGVVLEFIERTNAHDVKGMCALMTNDHLFVDSLGEQIRGKEAMRRAWIEYFYLFPDFTIQCSEIFSRDNGVALFGTARGTYTVGKGPVQENTWQMPAAWRAEVRENLLVEWRIYADNEPVRKLMGLQDTG